MNMAKFQTLNTIKPKTNQKLWYKHMKPFYLTGMLRCFFLYTPNCLHTENTVHENQTLWPIDY